MLKIAHLATAVLIFVLAPAFSAPTSAIAATKNPPDPGLHYHVIGVAAGDMLNVRDEPGTDGRIVGAYSAKAVDIVVTGVAQTLDGSEWWQVIYPGDPDKTAWVNGRYLRTGQLGNGESNYPLLCVGTEPFWSLEIGPNSALFTLLGENDSSLTASSWKEAEGIFGQFAIQINNQDGKSKKGFAVVSREWGGSCSDGMSENGYPFTGTVILPTGQVYGGCCMRSAR